MRGLLSGKFSRERCKRVASCESRCVACRVSRVAWYCEPAPHDTAQALIISYRSEFALGRRYTAPRGFTYRCFTGKYIPQKKFHVKCCRLDHMARPVKKLSDLTYSQASTRPNSTSLNFPNCNKYLSQSLNILSLGKL